MHGAEQNENPHRRRYFSARAVPLRVERDPTVQAGTATVHRGSQSRARPHGTRQQPPITCVPMVFDYILIQRCKSKKLCRAQRWNTQPFTGNGAIQRRKARGMQSALRRGKRKNPLPAARRRFRKAAAIAPNRREIRKTYEIPATPRLRRQIKARAPDSDGGEDFTILPQKAEAFGKRAPRRERQKSAPIHGALF